MPQRPPQKKKPPLFTNKQWQQCYESWLLSTRERSGSTCSEYEYRLTTQRFFTVVNKTPDKYTRADVEAFVRSQFLDHNGVLTSSRPATQNQRLSILRSFYEFAAQYDVPFRKSVRPIMHEPDPTRGMKLLKRGRRRRDLSEAELKQFFAAIPRETLRDKRDYALFSCYFWTARRKQEIARLRWGDIYSVVFVDEDGRQRQGYMYRYVAKGHSREVFTAEFPQPAYDALQEYLQAAGIWGKMKPEQPLFTRLDRGLPGEETEQMSKSTIDWTMRKYAKLAALKDVPSDRQICIHSMRHTRARATFKRKHNIMEIKELLGHSSVASTQIYLVESENKADAGALLLASEFGKL